MTGDKGAGMRGSRLRGNDGAFGGNDVCEQCSNQHCDGTMGSCRWFGMAVAGREGGSRTAPTPRQGSHLASLWKVLVFGHFGRYPTSGARGCSGVIRSGDPPYLGPIWPDSLPGTYAPSQGCEVPVCTGTTEAWPRAANLLIRLHFVAFPLVRTLTLTWIPAFAGVSVL